MLSIESYFKMWRKPWWHYWNKCNQKLNLYSWNVILEIPLLTCLYFPSASTVRSDIVVVWSTTSRPGRSGLVHQLSNRCVMNSEFGNDCIFSYQYLVTAIKSSEDGKFHFTKYLVVALIKQWRRETWRSVPSTCLITREDGNASHCLYLSVPSTCLITREDGNACALAST